MAQIRLGAALLLVVAGCGSRSSGRAVCKPAATAGWTNRSADGLYSTWPVADPNQALFWDARRERIVLVGGGASHFDVHEWEGDAGAWTNRTPSHVPAAWPQPGQGYALAYDEARHKAVLFGGAELSHTWEWDGDAGTWADRTPAVLPTSWPKARSGHRMLYDFARGHVIIFGGTDAEDYRQYYWDLWEWDGDAQAWTDRTPSPVPPSWPSGIYGYAMGADPKMAGVLLFGGGNGDSYLQTLWKWDGSAGIWSDVTPTPLPASWPAAREDATMVSACNAAVLLGGGTPSTILKDLWEWNGSWTDRTPSPKPTDWPTPSTQLGFAYDRTRSKLVVLGQPDKHQQVGIWEWDGS